MRYLLFIGCLFTMVVSHSQNWREELNLARNLYKTKQYYSAYNRYLKVDKIKPKDINIKPEIAQAAYKAGYYEKASKIYKKANRKNENNQTDINYNIGNSYYNSDKYKEAIDAYKKALRARPSDEKIRHNLTLALKKNINNKPKSQPKDNSNKKNPPKPKPNPQNNDKKQHEDKQNQLQQSMQNDRAERMLDELMKQEMRTKQNKNKANAKVKSSDNEKDW